MNNSTLPFFISIILLFFACSKSEEDRSQNLDCTQVDTRTPFFSKELADSLLTHMIWVDADNRFFDRADAANFISLNRFKKFGHEEGLFNYTASGITAKSRVINELIVEQTSIPSFEPYYRIYGFNNAYDTVISTDNIIYDRLTYLNFSNINFQFNIDNNTCYQGTFPALLSLESPTQELEHPILSISKGGTLKWNGSEALPNSFVSIFIEHHATEVNNPRQATKVFKTADTGVFEIQPTMLEGLQNGDWLGIYIRRDAFVQQDNLLVRSSETQYWTSVPVYQ